MKPTQKTPQRPIRDKEAITRSQWEFRQKQGNCLTRGKRWMTERNIQQTPVIANTFSSPKYCERRIPQEKCRFPKHLTCEEKSRVFFEHVMSITHDVMCRTSHVPCTRVILPWEHQQLRTQFEYKRAKITYDGHYRGCLSTEQRTENGFSEVLRVSVV